MHKLHCVCTGLLLSLLSASVTAQSTPGAPQPAAMSSSVLANGTLYVSGQGSRSADGKRASGFDQQAAQAMKNLQAVLRTAGMDFGNIVWLNIYVTDTHNLAALEDVYWQQIGDAPPARTVLTVAALPDGEAITINCIAVADKAQRKTVWPAAWPHGAHSDPPAIQAGEMIYLSAQPGADPVTGKLKADFSAETRQSLDNVATILQTAHMSMKNVVWVNPYMSVGGQYDMMGKVYKTFFEFGNTPGRGTIQVTGLPHGEHVTFSCIAGADLSKRKAIKPRNMPPSPTASPGILYGDTLYLSAKDGFIPGQGLVTPLFDLQLRQSMRNLLDGLEEANMTFSDVVFSTVYLRQMKDDGAMNELYSKFLTAPYPARTTLQQNLEVNEEAAEQISFIAVKREGKSASR